MDEKRIADIRSEPIKADNTVNGVTRRILSLDGNRLKLVFAQMICVLFSISIYILSFTPSYFATYVDENGELQIGDIPLAISFIIMIVFLILILPPMLAGYSSFTMKTSRGEAPPITEIFAYFKSIKAYFSSFALLFVRLARLLLVLLPAIGGISFISFSDPEFFAIEIAKSIFILFLTLMAVAVGAHLASCLFFAPYLIQNGMSLSHALAASLRMSRTRRTDITKHTMSHIPSVIASVISFAVLALIYTVPKVSVSYYVYCDATLRNTEE